MYEDDEEADFRPPPPLRIGTLAYPNSSPASSIKSRKPVDNHNNNNSSSNNMNTFRTLKRENVARKPTPTSSIFSLSAKSSSDALRSQHSRERSTTPDREYVPAPKSRGFGLGSVVKEKVAARRKPVDIVSTGEVMDPLEASSPVAAVKPPNFVSIDDWLDSREREGLHRRSNTVTTVASQATRYDASHRLHLRQSTFAPLPTPHELAPPESIPQLPMIPQQYTQTTPKTPPPLISSRPRPSPPREPPRVDQPPRDHLEQLEYEHEQLEVRKSNIKREMWDLEQLLPPNPSTHNPVARKDMSKRLEELVPELADVEKEIHETGMKLHRAWRRRDKNMGSEGPTHLWVSRVRDAA